jgi:hypothetical protein
MSVNVLVTRHCAASSKQHTAAHGTDLRGHNSTWYVGAVRCACSLGGFCIRRRLRPSWVAVFVVAVALCT